MNWWPDTFNRYAEKMIFDALKFIAAVIVFLTTCIQPVSGQRIQDPDNQFSYVNLVNQFYGNDQILVNGILYYNRYVRCKGLPYLTGNDFMNGELTLQGKNFPNVKVRYDITSQCVELAYFNMKGTRNWLFTVADHIEAFRVGEYQFLKLDLDAHSEKFYQVIRTGLFTCYVHWEKRLLPLQNDPDYSRVFSEADVYCLLEMEGSIKGFKNRKTFSRLFPEHVQKEIKRLLKRNHFKVQHAAPGEMVRNMNAVADLLRTGGLP